MQIAYEALSTEGRSVSGVISAESESEARQLLRRRGLYPSTVTSAPATTEPSAGTETPAGLSRRRISRQDVMILISQLAIMSRAGVDLADALSSLSRSATSTAVQHMLITVEESLKAGVPLSRAFADFPQVFDHVSLALIRAGESSGTMTESLERSAAILRNEVRIRSAVRGALAYPAVLTGVCGLVLAAIVFFVLPQFSLVFRDIGLKPPALTAALLSLGNVIHSAPVACFCGIIMILAALLFAAKSPRFAALRELLWLHGYLTAAPARAVQSGRFFRLLGVMLDSGVPLMDSLTLCRDAFQDGPYRTLIESLREEVTLGNSIGPRLQVCPVMPSGAAQMVLTAERAGNLAEVLKLIGLHYEEDGERMLKERVRLLEPGVIVCMGILVGGIVAAVMLPLFEFSAGRGL